MMGAQKMLAEGALVQTALPFALPVVVAAVHRGCRRVLNSSIVFPMLFTLLREYSCV